MPIHKKKRENFISLKEAAKICRYSQEYLSLCARQGRLKAKKNKRNWVTKKAWLDKYLQYTKGRKNGSQLSDLSSIAQPPAGGGAKEDTSDTFNVPSNLPTGEPAFATLKRGYGVAKPASSDAGKPYFPLNFRFAFAFFFVCVLLFTGTVFYKNVFYDVSDFTRRGFAHINETIISDISQSKEDVKNITQFVKLPVAKICGDTYQGFVIFADDLELPKFDNLSRLCHAEAWLRRGEARLRQGFGRQALINNNLSLIGVQAKNTFYAMPGVTLSELLEPEITMPKFYSLKTVLELLDNAYLQTAQLSAISVDTAESYFSWLRDRAPNVSRTVLTTFEKEKNKITGIFKAKEKIELKEKMIAQEISQEIKNEIQEIKFQNEFLTKEIQRIEEQGLSAKKVISEKVVVEKVIIGEFEIRDKATGEIWCTWIENSEWVKQQGTCATLSAEK